MIDLFFEHILTLEDALYFKEKIIKLQQLVFKSSGLLSEKAKNLGEEKLVEIILKAEGEKKIFSEPETQFNFLEELQKKLESLPVLKITLAFLPSRKSIERIVNFIRKESGEKIILDIFIDPEIVGGAILEYRGKYLDFSLKNEVKKFFKLK